MNHIDITLYKLDIIKVLKKKKASEYGFIKYSNFKKLISHISNIKKQYIVRKIFLELLDDSIFIKKKNENINSYLYKFRSDRDICVTKKSITIDFI